MANLTLAIDDELLKRARRRALERGTSVNALLRDYLQAFADQGGADDARSTLLSLSTAVDSGSGSAGRTWTREIAHER